MDKPTTDALDLVARVEAEIKAQKPNAIDCVDQYEAALEKSGWSADEKRTHREKTYFALRMLQCRYYQGFEIAGEAYNRLMPELIGAPLIVTPIKRRPRLTLVACRERDDAQQ